MYYNEETIIYYNGAFVKAIEANGNVYDQTLHYGYGVFEGIRAYDTANGVRIFKAQEHFDRMRFSCEAIGIPYPYSNAELIDISYEVLQRNNLSDAYLRPLVTCPPNMSLTKGRGAQLLIAAWEWGAYLGEKLLRLKTSSYRRISPKNFIVEAKVSGHYVNSILATQEAKDLGYDEALLLDMEGFIAEGPGANIFIEKDQTLYTPQLGSILPGITRATVIEISKELGIPVIEKQIRLEEVYNADSVFLCGTAAEIIGVESLDDQTFQKPWSESIGAVIKHAYKNLVLEKDYKNVHAH
ncbi:branched-chain amino acid transaminase [Flavisolibacter tropicus]|uniref:Branched-chain-amino-acid aminotransferase n=1 Tax=Flavisolibacter tropicus TaxID=1492898 RepID=A0A172TRS4_9BACT|nr:branched-chain amino acid transaminase [Flavisolibacter tropicus]ANE49688.1 branched-chain amino acid aminotransferase [Flavisolibacter tropicus]